MIASDALARDEQHSLLCPRANVSCRAHTSTLTIATTLVAGSQARSTGRAHTGTLLVAA